MGFLEEKYGITLRKTYNWDSPDGENCFYKFAHSLKFGAAVGKYCYHYTVQFLLPEQTNNILRIFSF